MQFNSDLNSQSLSDFTSLNHGFRSGILQNSSEVLRSVVEACQFGLFEWDLTSDEISFDSKAAKLFGLSPDISVLSRTDLLRCVHPDDSRELDLELQSTALQLTCLDAEFRVVHGDGQRLTLSTRGNLVKRSLDAPLKLVGVFNDITLRKRREDELLIRDRALDATTDGIVITLANHPDYSVIYANPAFEALTGYSAREVMGSNLRFLQGPNTNPETIEKIREGLATGAGAHVTILNYRKDGSSFWCDLWITPIRDARGVVTHYIGAQSDITAQREFEQTLMKAEARALAASEAKSEFLANMSHEIRTPLTAVLGCADTLYPRLTRVEHREVLQMIRNEGRVLLGILNDILDLSKIEAGRLEVHEEECSIVSVITDVHSLLSSQASEKGIELRVQYATRMPSRVMTDPLRVRQILMNLVGNALKFTENGTVTIRVRCDRSGSEPLLLIEVEDTGIGIPPDRLALVFEAFQQLQTPSSRKLGGTGLGLTISQQLVRMLGGEISVRSTVGTGTSFTVSIPIRSKGSLSFESAELLVQAADEQHRSRDSVDIMLPLSILVAEDSRGIQFMIRRMLEDAGATVAVVENGERAVNATLQASRRGSPFDLIVMDMQMPVMSGYEATSQLRRVGVQTPIVALTAAAMKGDREECLKVGCDEYLSKPIDRHLLLNAVARQYNRVLSLRTNLTN